MHLERGTLATYRWTTTYGLTYSMELRFDTYHYDYDTGVADEEWWTVIDGGDGSVWMPGDRYTRKVP